MKDALNRAWRTVLQGIVLVALVAAGDVALAALRDGRTDFRNIGVAAITAAGMAAASYVHRRWIDPTPLPSARPPGEWYPTRRGGL